MASLNDAHCHFFSTPFFAALGGDAALATLGWEAPGSADALAGGALRAVCLFPAMHRYPIHDERVHKIFSAAAARPGTAVFVHCGVLSVGVRKKLGLASPFDISLGTP